jgi:hypothetical protein
MVVSFGDFLHGGLPASARYMRFAPPKGDLNFSGKRKDSDGRSHENQPNFTPTHNGKLPRRFLKADAALFPHLSPHLFTSPRPSPVICTHFGCRDFWGLIPLRIVDSQRR